MRKISLGLIILVTVLTIAAPASASTPFGREIKDTIRETVEDGRVEGSSPAAIRREAKDNIKKEVKERFLDRVRSFLKKNLRFEARVGGTISVIGDSSFSLIGDDGTFQINVTDKTQLLMKFGGKSKLSDYSVGDEVRVFGKFTDETKLVIDARVVKNNSIQKRKGAFFGKVTVKNGDNFVIDTKERGTQTVYFGTATFVERNETPMTYTDMKVDDRVRVKGVWDKTLSTITEVTQIKDFSLPVVIPTEAADN